MNENELGLHQAVFGNYPDDKVVACSKDKIYLQKDFRASIKALALYFYKQQGVKNIALCIENAYFFSVAFTATLYAKKTPVLLGNITAHSFDEIENKADLVITDFTVGEIGVPSARIETLLNSFNKSQTFGQEETSTLENRLFCSLEENSPIIFYTSGTTGQSKRINKSLRSMQIDIRCFHRISGFLDNLENILLLSTVPPYHMYGLTYRIFMPLLRHMPMTTYIIRYSEELEHYKENIIFVSSPAFVKRLDTKIQAPQIKLCISAGSPMPDDAALNFYNWSHCAITEIYGSTEGNSMAYRRNKGDNPLFTPFDVVKFVKTDDGYELDSQMSDGYRTLGDNLEFEGPHFRIKGRKDKIVKIEENRISLTQIEKLLKDKDFIKDAVALAVTKNGRTCIGAVCVLEDSFASDYNNQIQNVLPKKVVVNSLREYLKGYLPAVAIPRYYRIVDKIPVNHMGKRITPLLEELFQNDQT